MCLEILLKLFEDCWKNNERMSYQGPMRMGFEMFFVQCMFVNFFVFISPEGSPSQQGVSETEFMERIRERMAQEVGGYVSRFKNCL